MKEEAAEFPTVSFLSNNLCTVDETLAADIVVCHDSGPGNDALMKRKLSVALGRPARYLLTKRLENRECGSQRNYPTDGIGGVF